MTFQILDITIYSHDGRRTTVPFRIGEVNLVTGQSGTGKSALIPIIEYCLARDCTIPDGPVLKKASWYVLRIQFPTYQAIIGRQAPEKVGSNPSAMFWQIGKNLELPLQTELQQNSTTDAVEGELTRLMGISPNLHVPPEGQTRSKVEARLPHALYYTLQEQTEIADKKLLFHGQELHFRKQHMVDTLPYLLGAVPEDQLRIRQDLHRAKKQLRDAERQFAEARRIAGESSSRATNLLLEAQEVGLLTSDVKLSNQSDAVLELRKAANWEPGTLQTIKPNTKLAQLQRERREARRSLQAISAEIEQIREFGNEIQGYATSAKDQQQRLAAASLFEAPDENSCPVCLSPGESATQTNTRLHEALAQLKQRVDVTTAEQPRVRDRLEQLEQARDDWATRIKNTDDAIGNLVRQDDDLRGMQTHETAQALVVGRLRLYLEGLAEATDEGTLAQKVAAADAEVARLEKALSGDERALRLSYILTNINADIMTWSRRLKLEHSQHNLFLDLKNLTLVADKGNEQTPLWRMGSGENFVGYHVVVHLALHKHFAVAERPVPRYLFLDQPSQAHFPADPNSPFFDPSKPDPDRLAVLNLLHLIIEVVDSLNHRFQVIIADHLRLNDEKINKTVTMKWWDGAKLVPDDWPERLPISALSAP